MVPHWTEMQSREGDPRPRCPSVILPLHPGPVASAPFPSPRNKLHAALCVVLCGGHPRVCPQPCCSWRASESTRRQHGSTAHAHGALLHSAPPERAPSSLQPNCPLARHTLCRTSPETHTSHGCGAAGLPAAHARASSRARRPHEASHAHADAKLPRHGISLQCSAHCGAPPCAPSLVGCRHPSLATLGA